ncbi:xylulokinase [Candidatus Seribacter sulfatis]|jgi:xylulokinase|uniref:xylulokinase n=1 Tax=Candidatus Seribacter sulfatis TaxID=3381756 RepID=UPI00389AF549
MYYIGIDIGTSSVKALLIDSGGRVIKTSVPEYSFQTPKPLWAEADPLDWWEATQQAIKELLLKVQSSEIAGIGLTGQMHGMVAMNKEGSVLRPCIMWNDQRSHLECDEITERVGQKKILSITGNPVLPGFTAPKILWTQKNEPDLFALIDKVVLPKDFIRYKLTGSFFSDVSDASGTSLLDVGKRTWSQEMFDCMGWPISWMPEVTESTEVSAKISAEAATLTGLLEGTPVVAGGGDCAAQAVGSGIVEEGKVSVTLGTSGVVFAQSDEYRVEPNGKLHAFCHAVPGKWHVMGVMLSAAGSFQWYKNQFGMEEQRIEKEGGANAYETLTKEAQQVIAGSEGLFFLPYLSGERTPHPDPYARGCFIGMSLRHQKKHHTRAVLEGVSYGLNDSLSMMQELGVNPNEIILSGGGSRSALWKQMLADIFATPCAMVNALEGAAYGAAILAAVGVGGFGTVQEACSSFIQKIETVDPGPNLETYKRNYPIYKSLYPSLKAQFAKIAESNALNS